MSKMADAPRPTPHTMENAIAATNAAMRFEAADPEKVRRERQEAAEELIALFDNNAHKAARYLAEKRGLEISAERLSQLARGVKR